MPLFLLTSSLKDGWQKPWLRKRSVTFRFIASVRWIPSQLIYLLGSLHLTVPGEPHNEFRLKFNGPPAAPQQGLKSSSNWYFLWFILIVRYAFQKSAYKIWQLGYNLRNLSNLLCRIWLWIITAVLTAAAHPIWSRAAFTGHNEICSGRHPIGGKPWTTIYFAPLPSAAYTYTTDYLALLLCQIPAILIVHLDKFLGYYECFFFKKQESLFWNVKVFGLFGQNPEKFKCFWLEVETVFSFVKEKPGKVAS